MMNNRTSAAALLWAVAAAMTDASAQSGTQIYGILDMWGGVSRTSGAGPAQQVLNSGGMTTSYWGVGGSEDLGGQSRAVYALEGYLQLDTGAAGRSATDALFARNAYVGVSGALGEVKAGRILNPLFVATAQVNPFGGSIRFAPLLAQTWSAPFGRAVYGDTSWDNTVMYTSPALGGARVAAYAGLGETAYGSGTGNAGATVSYAGQDWYAVGSAQRVGVGPGLAAIGASRQSTYFAGGWYDLKAVKLFASWGRADAVRPDAQARTAQLGAALPAGPGSVMLSWARTAGGAADTLRNTGAAGYDYFLSRRTDVYAVVQHDRLGGAGSARSYAAGLRLKF